MNPCANPSSDPAAVPATPVQDAAAVILAFDTSTEYCSVALLVAQAGADPFMPWREVQQGGTLNAQVGARLYVRHEHTGAVSSARLLPLIQEVLAEAGVALAACDAIAFGAGPGSFTGLRTATGVAQGLAFGLGIPVVPVGTLMACAEAARAADAQAGCVLSALDARMDEVYWGCFEWQGGAHAGAPLGWTSAPAAALDAPENLPVPASPYTLAGSAAEVFGARLSVFAGAHSVATQALPHAAAVALLGWRGWRHGQALDAAQAAPLYIRDKIAQTTAERDLARASRVAAEAAEAAAR